MRTLAIWLTLPTLLTLTACGGGPAESLFLLGHPAEAPVGAAPGTPPLMVRTAIVPDYLDTGDIVRRGAGNQITVSTGGRWGERLSLGITDALAAALALRLPGRTVTTLAPTESGGLTLSLDVTAFEIGADGPCRFSARWKLVGAGASPDTGSEFSVAEDATPGDDASAAAAMTRAIDRLAATIATTLGPP